MSINNKNNVGETPLFFACFVGYLDIVKLLVDNGAIVDISNNDGETPLIYAVKKGYSFIVEYLVQKSTNLNEQDINGNTALMLACILGRKAPNKDEYVKCAKLLIDAGASVTVKNQEGNSVLSYAIMMLDESLVRLIIGKIGMQIDSIL
jgi:ankyrin repeat protein